MTTTTTNTHVTALDRAQQRLDQLGALVEASRRDPESVGAATLADDSSNVLSTQHEAKAVDKSTDSESTAPS